jgi:hypothetical protein
MFRMTARQGSTDSAEFVIPGESSTMPKKLAEPTVSRRPDGARSLIWRLTQDCVRWRELVLG